MLSRLANMASRHAKHQRHHQIGRPYSRKEGKTVEKNSINYDIIAPICARQMQEIEQQTGKKPVAIYLEGESSRTTDAFIKACKLIKYDIKLSQLYPVNFDDTVLDKHIKRYPTNTYCGNIDDITDEKIGIKFVEEHKPTCIFYDGCGLITGNKTLGTDPKKGINNFFKKYAFDGMYFAATFALRNNIGYDQQEMITLVRDEMNNILEINSLEKNMEYTLYGKGGQTRIFLDAILRYEK